MRAKLDVLRGWFVLLRVGLGFVPGGGCSREIDGCHVSGRLPCPQGHFASLPWCFLAFPDARLFPFSFPFSFTFRVDIAEGGIFTPMGRIHHISNTEYSEHLDVLFRGGRVWTTRGFLLSL